MRSSQILLIGIITALATSCGESSTKDTGTKDSVSTTTTTMDNRMQETVPVTTTVVVPEPAKMSFEKKYPNVSNVTWTRYEPISTFDWEWSGWPSMDTADYMVKYNLDNTDYWSWYDNDNNWVGTVSPVTDFAGLPAKVNSSIQSNFPGYTIVSVDKENDKNRTAYEVELTKDGDKMKALIAENGAILKKKGMMDGEKMKEKM